MELTELRSKIDEIDDEILRLFKARMDITAQVAEAKRGGGGGITHPEREREVVARLAAQADKSLTPYVRGLYDTLFAISREYQARLLSPGDAPLTKAIHNALETTPKLMADDARVACQGVLGAYSQLACDKLFPNAEIMYFKSFEGVFNAVEKGFCEYGVLPIENSTYGAVREVYDLFRHHGVYIVRGTRLQICHALLANNGASLGGIKEIFSHEQAIGQCSAFLAANPDIKVTVCENTAVAARTVRESGRLDAASISSPECARLYDLKTLVDSVRNEDSNYTRFVVISKSLRIFPGATKLSFLTTTQHRPGALLALLSKFSLLGVNISKLESRPIPGRDFDFMFYFDLDASVYSDELVKLLGDLSAAPEFFSFLGAYTEV